MTKSDIQKKFEDLYKDVDPQSRKQDDKALIRDELASIRTKELWESGYLSKEKASQRWKDFAKTEKGKQVRKEAVVKAQSIEARKKRKDTKLENGHIKTKEFWQEIYDQFWDHNRNDPKFKRKIIKQYDISEGTLHTLVHGGGNGMNVNDSLKRNHNKKLKKWSISFGDLQWWWIVYEPQNKNPKKFESLSEVQKFVSEKSTESAHSLFTDDSPKTKMSRSWKGWRFEKVNRKTGKVENRKGKVFDFDINLEQALHIEKTFVKGKNKSNPGNVKELSEQYNVSADTIRLIARGDYRKRCYWL